MKYVHNFMLIEQSFLCTSIGPKKMFISCLPYLQYWLLYASNKGSLVCIWWILIKEIDGTILHSLFDLLLSFF